MVLTVTLGCFFYGILVLTSGHYWQEEGANDENKNSQHQPF
jgi:hypothetical protein